MVRNLKTRNEILKTAYGLFASEGYDAASLSAIAQGAGISKSLLQNYYRRKLDIMQNLLNDILTQSFTYMQRFQIPGEDPFEQISRFNTLFFAGVSTDRELENFITISVSSPELLEIWIETITEWLWNVMGNRTYSYLKIKAAIAFSMAGSMHLYTRRNELGLDFIFICDHHIRAILSYLEMPAERIQAICLSTQESLNQLDAEGFIAYCREKLSWMPAY